jgi:hypothetical protein
MTLRKKRDLALYPFIVEAARGNYAEPSDNDLEIYDQPDVAGAGDGGFWVRAYVYIRRHEAEELRDLAKRTTKAARVPIMKALLA